MDNSTDIPHRDTWGGFLKDTSTPDCRRVQVTRLNDAIYLPSAPDVNNFPPIDNMSKISFKSLCSPKGGAIRKRSRALGRLRSVSRVVNLIDIPVQ